VSSFEHIKFAISEKYFLKLYDNPNYYVSVMIFQTYKNIVLRNVHFLGGSFDCVFTQPFSNISKISFYKAYLNEINESNHLGGKCF
jgi:hypothetical protein